MMRIHEDRRLNIVPTLAESDETGLVKVGGEQSARHSVTKHAYDNAHCVRTDSGSLVSAAWAFHGHALGGSEDLNTHITVFAQRKGVATDDRESESDVPSSVSIGQSCGEIVPDLSLLGIRIQTDLTYLRFSLGDHQQKGSDMVLI